MKFPVIAVLVFAGGVLVTAGTLAGQDVMLGIGLVCWAIAALIVAHLIGRFFANAWHDWRMKCYFRELRKRSTTPTTRYSPGAGLR